MPAKKEGICISNAVCTLFLATMQINSLVSVGQEKKKVDKVVFPSSDGKSGKKVGRATPMARSIHALNSDEKRN